SQQAATKNRGKAIVNSPQPIYDQEPSMVAEDDEMSKESEIDKLMALISLSINKSTGYENQRIGNVAGAKKTVETITGEGCSLTQGKMLWCKQEEAIIQLNAEQANWRDDTKDESKDQELEAHYIYMVQLQEFSLDAVDSGPIFDPEPSQKVSNDDHYNVFAINSEHPEQSESVHDTYHIEQEEHNVIIDSLDMSYDREQIDQNDDDNDLSNEREFLASLIDKLKCKIDNSKNRNKFLETSNKVLVEKLKGEIEDFKNKNIILESSNNRFKEENNKLSEINNLMYNDFKKSQVERARHNNVEYASKKKAQIKLYKTRKDKELDKVIALENKVKVLDNIVYKTGQSVQTMNMLNNKCQTSFAKHEFLKKAQRADPRLYDIGCYNDNLALLLAPESDEVIRLEKESRSKLSDLVRHIDYDKLNNLYDLFVPQRKKSSEQRYFSERSRLSHTTVNNGNSKESFNKKTTLLEKQMDESILWDQKFKSSIELFKIKSSVGTIFDGVEHSLRSQLETQKTQFLNEIDRLSREYYYADHMNAIFCVYTELDEVTNLQSLQKYAINLEIDLRQCQEKIKNDTSFKENQSKEFYKEREQYFEIQDLKAQLQDKGIVISELKKLIAKLKGKYMDTKFGKSSVIRKPNAFKSQRPSILGKPTIFLGSLKRKDFSRSKSVTQNYVSNDFSKPVAAKTFPLIKKSILKNTNVLAPGMYKLHIEPTQTRTSQLPQDSRKTNKRVSFFTGVIPTNSVSRPQLKSNPMEDRVILNNSKGKKQEVGDQHRNVKLSKNKTSVTACNDSLNAKTLNVNFVCATCGKCVLNEKHDMCVLKSVNGVISRTKIPIVVLLVEIVLFIIDSGCSKHMMRNLKLLINFVEKFLGLNHNLFSVGQLCNADMEVAFRKSTFYIHDLKGNDLLTGSHGTDLYLIRLQDTNSPNPIFLMAKATSSQAWLWDSRLSHLNFDTINLLSKNDIVVGLPITPRVFGSLTSSINSQSTFCILRVYFKS
nr:hypothetical protein [Tanacetum cinerariifolium]